MPKHEDPKKVTIGITDWDKAAEEKTIRIADNLRGKELMDTVIHEMLHAADYYKDEEWVEKVASDITRLLWRLGFRQK